MTKAWLRKSSPKTVSFLGICLDWKTSTVLPKLTTCTPARPPPPPPPPSELPTLGIQGIISGSRSDAPAAMRCNQSVRSHDLGLGLACSFRERSAHRIGKTSLQLLVQRLHVVRKRPRNPC